MFIGVFLGIIIGSVILFGSIRTAVSSLSDPDFHEHADFVMFISGEQFDFSLEEFMSVEPCKIADNSIFQTAYAHGDEELLNEEDYEGENYLKEIVHLHNGVGEVIHIHKEGVTYGDFFGSLEMEFDDEVFVDHLGNIVENDSENEFRFFVNGEEVDSISGQEIRDLDRTLITYGPRDRDFDDVQIEMAKIGNDACYYSETCQHRGAAPLEYCGATPSFPWILKAVGFEEEQLGF